MESKEAQVLNPASILSLESWVKKTAVNLVQVNGQRKYGGPPPGWSGPAPGSGCEIYISQIPRDVYEDRLIPLFQSAGTLYEFRLMMNFSGQNRGFAYAKYGSPQAAAAAVLRLHRCELQLGTRLVVRRSIEKRQLRLGGLPISAEQERLLQVLRDLSDGVETVSLASTDEEAVAVVQYCSHYAASMAKKVLCEAFQKKFAIQVTVKWAFVEKPRKDADQKKRPTSCPPIHPRRASRPCSVPPHPIHHKVDAAVSRHFPMPQPAQKAREDLASVNAEVLLRKMCNMLEVGPPLYHIQSSHTGADGFLYFCIRIEIPGLPLPFEGTVRVLPGGNSRPMKDELRQGAAEKVLRLLCQASPPLYLQ